MRRINQIENGRTRIDWTCVTPTRPSCNPSASRLSRGSIGEGPYRVMRATTSTEKRRD